MCYAEIKTKGARVQYIRDMIVKSDRWMLKALFTVFANQTADEQKAGSVEEDNGIGFTGVDGEILTDFAKKLIARGVPALVADLTQPVDASRFMSPKQLAILKKKMPKYARQLSEIANKNVPIDKTKKA